MDNSNCLTLKTVSPLDFTLFEREARIELFERSEFSSLASRSNNVVPNI